MAGYLVRVTYTNSKARAMRRVDVREKARANRCAKCEVKQKILAKYQSQGLKRSKGRAVESLGKEAAEGRREGSLEVTEVGLKSRDNAAFGTLERAQHWTALHFAQTIPKSTLPAYPPPAMLPPNHVLAHACIGFIPFCPKIASAA